MSPIETAVILGAGFSFAAGLPLTRQFFEDIPRSQSDSARKNHEEVFLAYRQWRNEHPNENPEEWLSELYQLKENPLQHMKHRTTWSHAVRFALARLVNLSPGSNAHYYYGICNSECHPVHAEFWRRIERDFGARYIVTLNYDILVEQALHSTVSRHRAAPRCYYGGFQHVQAVRVMERASKPQKFRLVQLGNDFVLYKLHGSVNWAWEKHSPTLKIHDDVRAVYRHDDSSGEPAVIPPIPEKEIPKEFSQVWNEAAKSLACCSLWIVCGYSLPSYDTALQDWFAGILRQRKATTLLLFDPNSTDVLPRWQQICPPPSRIVPLPGLPEAFDHNWSALKAEVVGAP